MSLIKVPIASPEKVASILRAFGEQEATRYNDEYAAKLLSKASQVQIGAMYYAGQINYRSFYDVYILDNIIQRPIQGKKSKKNKEPKYEFICLVRAWDWEKKVWTGLRNRLPEFAHEISLSDFLKDIHLPKLSRHPDDLYKEASEALASGDVSAYSLVADELESENGPDTKLMHLGSKETLENMHQSLEVRKNHAELVRMTMEMVIAQKKRELEAIKDKLEGSIALFEKKIRKIFRVITTLELYLGIDEEIIQILEGPTAPAQDPICIRQGLMFMDEEFGDPWDDGQGVEWKDLSAFGEWLVRNGNYKKVLPESKCIAAFKVRRNPKQRSGNPYWVARMEDIDKYTFLVIRNGDNIYRLITEKIEFMPRLFPRKKELQQLLELWKEADRVEQKQRQEDQKQFNQDNANRFSDPEEHESEVRNLEQQDYSETYFGTSGERSKAHEKYPDLSLGNFSRTGEVKEYAEDHVFFYKMRFTLFQGIIERTSIFQPLPEPVKLFDHSAVEKGLVRLIYDDELTLPTGRPGFWEWMKAMNDQIDFGSRIVLSHNWGFISDFLKGEGERDLYYAKKQVGNRFDDRFGDGTRFSRLPDDPGPGLYYVKKGTRWENVPKWIVNPHWRPELLTTPDEANYCPKEYEEECPKEIKAWYTEKEQRKYHAHITTLYLSYTKQKELFGKVVSKAPFPGYDSWRVPVLKNPKHIQAHLCVKDNTFNRFHHYQTEDKKVEYMCIRYNPKDKIDRIGWTWVFDAEERKNNLSWKITTDDAFILNYDLVTIEDIDFYLNSRVDRRHYIHMMPLLWEVRKQLEKERADESDFRQLVKGEVLKSIGVLPSDEQVNQECENWKRNLKWKRAIAHDDQKALRMIVKSLIKQLS